MRSHAKSQTLGILLSELGLGFDKINFLALSPWGRWVAKSKTTKIVPVAVQAPIELRLALISLGDHPTRKLNSHSACIKLLT